MDFKFSWIGKVLRWLGVIFGIVKKTKELMDETDNKDSGK